MSVILVLAAGVMLTGAPTPALRFYDDDPLWHEPDSQDGSGVEPWEIHLTYDVIENLFSRPGDPKPNVPAMNVNTVDEVPDSNWFRNRVGTRPLTPADVARGADTTSGPATGFWTITSAKSDGITPGFTVQDARGQVWFIKFDPPGYPAMATGTEVVVTKLFWALGYHVPENHIARFDRANLIVGQSATVEPPGARERAMDPADIDRLLKDVSRSPDGTYRVIASKALPGRPLGPFRFYGTRPDDPNDVIPHEHRRELRGLRVFAAWVNHVDSKSINSLDTLIPDNGRTVVRHHLLDFGSTLGSGAVWPREYWEGYEYLLEAPREIGRGVLGFGFYRQPWRTIHFFERPSIGRMPLDNGRWDPRSWRPRVPNPAFLRARPDDEFWAVRKIMAFTDDMIHAAVRGGEFGDPAGEAFLAEALIERRDAIGRAYLPAINPIVDPELDSEGVLTFANAAVRHGFEKAPAGYRAVWHTFDNATGETRRIGETSGASERLSAPEGMPTAAAGFVRIEVSAVNAPRASWEQPVDVFFRHAGRRGWILVGLVRLPDGAPDAPGGGSRQSDSAH